MMIDAASVASQYTSLAKSDREVQPVSISTETKPAKESVAETGQTSKVGPAVVNNVSAATLESSRAVKSAEQTADQTAPRDVVQETVSAPVEPPPQPPTGKEELTKSMLKGVAA